MPHFECQGVKEMETREKTIQEMIDPNLRNRMFGRSPVEGPEAKDIQDVTFPSTSCTTVFAFSHRWDSFSKVKCLKSSRIYIDPLYKEYFDLFKIRNSFSFFPLKSRPLYHDIFGWSWQSVHPLFSTHINLLLTRQNNLKSIKP